MKKAELKAFLDAKAAHYEQPAFLTQDPIQIPHRFELKEDIEIAGFLTAIIAWGNRLSILKSGTRLMEHMEDTSSIYLSTGMVMAIAQQVVQALEGSLAVHAENDDGSVIAIQLAAAA